MSRAKPDLVEIRVEETQVYCRNCGDLFGADAKKRGSRSAVRRMATVPKSIAWLAPGQLRSGRAHVFRRKSGSILSRSKPDLVVRWSRRSECLEYDGPWQDVRVLNSVVDHEILFNKKRTLVAELKARGYDITTLRISIRKKGT